MRVLFTTLPAFGHASPLCALAVELDKQGHDVAWVAHDEIRHRIRPTHTPFFAIPGGARRTTTQRRRRALAAVREYFTDILPRAAHAMLPHIREAIANFEPDVVVVEQSCIAGSIAARLEDVPWVAVHVTPVLLLKPFDALPGIQTWMDQQVGQIHRAHGVEPLPWPMRSPTKTLIASSADFLGEQADVREEDLFVGALIDADANEIDPSHWLGPSPRIVVSLGTLTGDAGRAFLERAITGLAGLGSVLVLSSLDLPTPEGVRVEPWAPLPKLMPHVDALLTHGGQNTVTEALLHGVPMVVAPVQFDQPGVALRVSAVGAGEMLSYADATAEDIGAAMRTVLGDPTYRANAARIGATLGPGTVQAAAHIVASA
ncbi:MAG: glycosyltransferase family 1 protein [Proteobacteria bacterium]|nr:glycosyltransferase family 1 protein [Pseudomonadota bacterium]